VVFN
jgi:hypothetical protein